MRFGAALLASAANEIPSQSVSATHLLGPAAPGVREANHRCVKTILH
jgi:hypothetical protein